MSVVLPATLYLTISLYVGPVIAAKDIKKPPSRPNFYVATSCDGKSRLRTQERQDASPTWSDARPLLVFSSSTPILLNLNANPTYLAYRSAPPGATLAFHLKQWHTLRDSLVGSVEITVDELRKLCERDERMSCCSLLCRNAAK